VKILLYENELCHGCELPFSQHDDVVVCPVCGTPQHRACWQANSACVSEALHAEGYLWKNDHAKAPGSFNPKTDLGIICPLCGTNNPADNEICEKCKAPLNQISPVSPPPAENAPLTSSAVLPVEKLPFLAGISPDEVIGKVRAFDIALFTQIGAKRYVDKFRKMELTGKKISWNWGAFFFTPYWFFYRKLYWLGGIFLGLTLALAIFFSPQQLELYNIYNTLPKVVTPAVMLKFQAQLTPLMPYFLSWFGLSFIMRSIAAFFGNAAYKKKMSTEILSIRRFSKNENTARMLTIKRGGTSFLALMASIICYDLVLQFVYYLVG
jgi:hypothetical protein